MPPTAGTRRQYVVRFGRARVARVQLRIVYANYRIIVFENAHEQTVGLVVGEKENNAIRSLFRQNDTSHGIQTLTSADGRFVSTFGVSTYGLCRTTQGNHDTRLAKALLTAITRRTNRNR